MTKVLISVVGPTAIGKTALGIKLANHFNAEIISADSRQFYKELSIGTAVPSTSELRAAPHHFIQHLSIEQEYNVGKFETDAIEKIQELHRTTDVVIMVGGSGLFVNAVTKGLDDLPKLDKDIRASLNEKFETEGLEALQVQLKALDPKAYQSIALDNPKRVIRALEVCLSSGKPYSSFLKGSQKNRPFKTITVGLTADRSIIYDRINKRVDIMIDNGLIDEVSSLISRQHLNALNTVGYKELFNYFNDEWTLDVAISEIKKNTRRFAKRQLTWFKKNEDTYWFDYQTDIKSIITTINDSIKKNKAIL